MIKVRAEGTPKQIFLLRDTIIKHVGTSCVSCDIPEAAVYGRGVYTAVFFVQSKYLDLRVVNSVTYAEIEVSFPNNQVYRKKKGSKIGKWICNESVVVTKINSFNDTEDDYSLGEYEELELWEMRRYS